MLQIMIILLISVSAKASVLGISTHPLDSRARVLSAEMTGYFSQHHEMGMGMRYTQDVDATTRADFMAAGGQDSRGLIAGGGVDFEMIHEDVSAPRFSVKPFVQYIRFETASDTVLGVAPSMRKELSIQGFEFFPYLGLPAGMKIDTTTDEFVYYASLSLGASMPFPGDRSEKLLLSIEGNKNLGAASDYLGALISWVWN